MPPTENSSPSSDAVRCPECNAVVGANEYACTFCGASVARQAAPGVEEDAEWDEVVRDGSSAAFATFLERHKDSPRKSLARELMAEAALFEAAATDDSADAWQQFLAFHPAGVHAAEAKRRLDTAIAAASEPQDFAAAEKAATVEAWNSYLERHPAGAHSTEVKLRRDELAQFQTASEADDETRWAAFAARWPAGAHADDARRRANELREERVAWESASQAGTPAALNDFLASRPASRHAAAARELLREAGDYERAMNGGFPEADVFLERYPSSRWAGAVARQRDLLIIRTAFREAAETDTSRAWHHFIEEHGERDVELRSRAQARLAQLAEASYSRAAASRTIDALQSFVDEFPESGRAADARRQILTMEAEREAAAFLTSSDPSAHVKPLIQADPRVLNDVIASAEREGKLEHLSVLTDFLESSVMIRNADAARARVAAYRHEQETEEEDWYAADDSNTAKAWRAFIEAHPSSSRVDQARFREQLAIEFEFVYASDSIASLQAFARTTSEDRYRVLAEQRIVDLQDAAAALAPAPTAPPAPAPAPPRVVVVDDVPVFESTSPAAFAAAASATPASPPLFEEEIQTLSIRRAKAQAEPPKEEAPAEAPPASVETDDDRLPSSDWFSRPSAPAPEPFNRELLLPLTTVAIEMPRPQAEPPPPAKPVRMYWALPLIAIFSLALAGAAVVLTLRYLHRARLDVSQTAVAAPSPSSTLVIDARPWGRVTSVRDAAGKEWLNVAADTPLALSLPIGRYVVSVTDPQSKQTSTANAMVVRSAPAQCEVKFRDVDISAFLAEGQR